MKNIRKPTLKEQNKKLKRKSKIFLGIIIIGLLYLAFNFGIDTYRSMNDVPDLDLNETEDLSAVDYLQQGIIGGVKGIVESNHSFFIKLLIFLGAVYIVQVGFSITGDIIELVLIVGVSLYRGGKWVYKKLNRSFTKPK